MVSMSGLRCITGFPEAINRNAWNVRNVHLVDEWDLGLSGKKGISLFCRHPLARDPCTVGICAPMGVNGSSPGKME